jgi:hypothetical protein
MRVWSCTMGAMCVSDTLRQALRFGLLARGASKGSDGRVREAVVGVKVLAWALELLGMTSGSVVGRMGGTWGEKRETCGGELLGVPPSTGSSELKDHASPGSSGWAAASMAAVRGTWSALRGAKEGYHRGAGERGERHEKKNKKKKERKKAR